MIYHLTTMAEMISSLTLPVPVSLPYFAGLAAGTTGKFIRLHERALMALRKCCSRKNRTDAAVDVKWQKRRGTGSMRSAAGDSTPATTPSRMAVSLAKNLERGEDSSTERMFRLCGVKLNVPFSQAIPYWKQQTTVKIAEGSYGEIYWFQHCDGQPRAFKVIPLGEKNAPESHASMETSLPDIVCSKCLSDLDEGPIYIAPNFPKIYNICFVKDTFPKHLVRSWYSYKNSPRRINDPVEHPPPDEYPDDQMYLTIESSFCGEPLTRKVLKNAWAGVSVCTQIAAALAVAEIALSFEHRDLHLGNVLVQPSDTVALKYSLGDVHFAVDTVGFHVHIIDFTISRIKFDNKDYCIGLDKSFLRSKKTESFSGNLWLDHQNIYEIMSRYSGGNWQQYMPVTNVVWLRYLLENVLDLMLENNPHLRVSIDQDTTEVSDQMRAALMLRRWNDCVLEHKSAADFLKRVVLVDNPRVTVIV